MTGIPGALPAAIVRKDLQLWMRGWRWAGVTTLYVGILGAVAIGFLLQKFGPTPVQTSRTGIQLFQALSIFQLLLIVFVTPASMAGAISGERQHRTWDLLIASRLSALEIVWGKLLGGLAFNVLLIVASLPLFSLVFIFGGVGSGDLIHTLVVLLTTVLLLGAVSVAVSALTERLTVSFMLSLVIALTLAIGVTIVTVVLQSPGQLSVVTLAGAPFQSSTTPTVLTPLAQLDPLVALLSAQPSEAGGTVLGGLGTIDHAFGLPWQLPLWGAYAILGSIIAGVLVFITAVMVGRSSGITPRLIRPASRPSGDTP